MFCLITKIGIICYSIVKWRLNYLIVALSFNRIDYLNTFVGYILIDKYLHVKG